MNPDQIKEMLAREFYEQYLKHTHRVQTVALQVPWEKLQDHEKAWCYEMIGAVALTLAKMGPNAWNPYLAFVRDHSTELLLRQLR